MSDILSEREPLIFYPKHAVEAERKLHEARIEAQAAEIERLEKACAEWAEVSQSNYQRAKAAEAKLAKTRLALDCFLLRDPDKPSSWEYTRDRAERLACTTLSDLTGDKT